MYPALLNKSARFRQSLHVVALAAVLATAACNRGGSGGQTVATVNGTPITTAELKLELNNLPPAQREKMKPQVLQAMIDRRLLVQEAQNQKIDKNPGFVLQQRRLNEVMLAQQAMQSFARASRQPISQTDVNAYLDRHPNIGTDRKILLVDQVQFQVPSQQVLDALKPAKTMDALIAVLRQRNIPVQRGRGQIDTAALPDDAMAKLAALGPGEPIVAVNGPNVVASTVIQQQAAPLGEQQQQKVARERMAAERSQTAIKQRGESLRQSAAITYADGYKPATPAAR